MFLGALVDAGLPLAALEAVVAGLGLPGVSVRAHRVTRGPLAATKVDVLVDGEVAEGPADAGGAAHEPPHEHGHGRGHDHQHGHDHGHGAPARAATLAHEAPRAHAHRHGHRTLPEVLDLLGRARGIAPEALADARRTFRALAEAEGRVHGVPAEEVRFHEVGALDALVDVTGTCAGFHALGVTEVRVGALPWPAGGSVRSAHGDLPLPAPAVAHLLLGHPTFAGGERFEQVTPTGAALVRALARGTAVPAGFVPRAVGLGAGTRDAGRLPNVLRLVLGDAGDEGTADDAVLLETNLDDATGQTVARAVERALAEGALDAWTVAATMKKGRPGHVVSVLARPEDAARLEAVLFAETPTLGVRRRAVARTVLAREHVTVTTPWGPVRMKVRAGPAGREATPEHDDCRRIADAHGLPLRDVLEAAARAWVP
jgi:uncharacterized protein (TIGR00299 family) protein